MANSLPLATWTESWPPVGHRGYSWEGQTILYNLCGSLEKGPFFAGAAPQHYEKMFTLNKHRIYLTAHEVTK